MGGRRFGESDGCEDADPADFVYVTIYERDRIEL